MTEKFTILSVKKRNWFVRNFYMEVNIWRVRVRLDTGEEMTFDCWAGLVDPRKDSLLHDLRRRITHEFESRKPKFESRKPKPDIAEKEQSLMELEGKDFLLGDC